MIPYFLLVMLPLLLNVFGKSYRLKINKKVLCQTRSVTIDAFMAIFLLLLVCRGLHCGIDTKQYFRLYNQYSENSIAQIFSDYGHEYGFKLLNRIVGVTVDNFQVLLGVTAVICVCPLWHFYRRESEDQLLTMALFLTVAPFMMYFSGIRQAIAMSLGIPAWYAARNKKWVRFLVLVFVAMQFHTSAFVLLLLYPLYFVKITSKWLWAVVPCITTVFAFRYSIFNFLFTYLWKDYNTTQATGATTVLLLLILFGVYAYILPDGKLMDNDTVAMRNILLLSIVIQIFAMIHPLSMRMNYYFLIFIPILIPKLASRSKKQFKQVSELSKSIMTVYFLCYFISMILKDNDSLNIFPYIPCWQN